jgi:transcriptional regulator with XRE-family HTH domain
MTDYKYIGERLKEYFGNIGLTQSEIAAKLGVSQQAVGAYLNGQPFGKKVAQKWSDLFKIQYNWLLTGEGAMLKESVPIPEETINLNITAMDLRSLLSAIEQHGDILRMNQEELKKQGERLDRILDIVTPFKQSKVG